MIHLAWSIRLTQDYWIAVNWWLFLSSKSEKYVITTILNSQVRPVQKIWRPLAVADAGQQAMEWYWICLIYAEEIDH